jgi:urea transport system substrate-binding protein
MQKNHHTIKNVYIGETKADGQFKIIKTFPQVPGEPFLKGTFKKAADATTPSSMTVAAAQ